MDGRLAADALLAQERQQPTQAAAFARLRLHSKRAFVGLAQNLAHLRQMVIFMHQPKQIASGSIQRPKRAKASKDHIKMRLLRPGIQKGVAHMSAVFQPFAQLYYPANRAPIWLVTRTPRNLDTSRQGGSQRRRFFRRSRRMQDDMAQR